MGKVEKQEELSQDFKAANSGKQTLIENSWEGDWRDRSVGSVLAEQA